MKDKIKVISNGIIFVEEGYGLILDYPDDFKCTVKNWIIDGGGIGFYVKGKITKDENGNQFHRGTVVGRLKFAIVRFLYRKDFKYRKKNPSSIIIEPIKKFL